MIDRPSQYEVLELEWRARYESGEDLPSPAATTIEPGPAAEEFLRTLPATAPLRPGWPYREPTAESEVLLGLPTALPERELPADLDERIAGAWIGRVAGNMLGKPVEVGWRRARLAEYLRASGSLDEGGLIRDWVVADAALAGEYGLEASWPVTTRGNVSGSVRDDDVDYTVLGLMLLERHGEALTGAHVGDAWLELLPYGQVFTAERAAYAALAAGVTPPASATTNNPYGEWIGALIRADAYGLALPGRPRRAATLALRDASVSHVRNGLYGAMWAASLVSNALVSGDSRQALVASLADIPERSRLAHVLRATLQESTVSQSWESALDRLDHLHGLDGLHHVHVLNNAAVIAVALLWSENDPARAVALSVQGALDTDSTSATVGSVMGALLGADALPRLWNADLGAGVRTGLFGVGELSLAELAARTSALARQFEVH